jgi:hypothetical protein
MTTDAPPRRPWPIARILIAMVAIPIIALAILAFGARVSCGCSSIAPSGATFGPSSPVEGIVVAVDAVSLGDVRGFTLRTTGGATYDFKLGTLEDPTDFPPGHLAEHQATSSPIRVSFRVENGERVVYRLEDAPE